MRRVAAPRRPSTSNTTPAKALISSEKRLDTTRCGVIIRKRNKCFLIKVENMKRSSSKAKEDEKRAGPGSWDGSTVSPVQPDLLCSCLEHILYVESQFPIFSSSQIGIQFLHYYRHFLGVKQKLAWRHTRHIFDTVLPIFERINPT